jgi:heme-degrading monooxygenase HmoA
MPYAKTPTVPYYAVIFTSVRVDGDNGYSSMSERMVKLVRDQDGFLGFESVREEIGITVSYWRDMESIAKWKANMEHVVAQDKGKQEWYSSYRIRIARVEEERSFG